MPSNDSHANPNNESDDKSNLKKNTSSSHLVQQTSLDMSQTGAEDYVPQQEMQMIPSTLTTESGRQPQGVHVLTSLQKNSNINSQQAQNFMSNQNSNRFSGNYNNNNNMNNEETSFSYA